jgi:hypothetical protein
MNSEKKNI